MFFDPLSLLFQLQSVVILFPLFDPMSQWKKEFLFVCIGYVSCVLCFEYAQSRNDENKKVKWNFSIVV